MTEIKVPISLGELIDKITILEIKAYFFTGDKLANVNKELRLLTLLLDELDLDINPSFFAHLKAINENLWQIEDAIRLKEFKSEFDDEFIRLARSVYLQNDKRASVKKELNITYGSFLTEEKSYQKYWLGSPSSPTIP